MRTEGLIEKWRHTNTNATVKNFPSVSYKLAELISRLVLNGWEQKSHWRTRGTRENRLVSVWIPKSIKSFKFSELGWSAARGAIVALFSFQYETIRDKIYEKSAIRVADGGGSGKESSRETAVSI
jgi:hypothetical protein